jgi:hypothetical protein
VKGQGPVTTSVAPSCTALPRIATCGPLMPVGSNSTVSGRWAIASRRAFLVLGPGAVDVRAHVLVDLATAHVAAGHREAAVTHTRAARQLALQIHSDRHLRRLAALVLPANGTPRDSGRAEVQPTLLDVRHDEQARLGSCGFRVTQLPPPGPGTR